MATSVDIELNEFNINDVESDELLEQMAEQNLLVENQLYVTPTVEKMQESGTKIIWREWE